MGRRIILYFSPINWGFLKQRPQHIAEELAKVNTVYYVEPTISIIRSLVSRKNFHSPRKFAVHEHLTVIKPDGTLKLPKIVDLIDFTGLNKLVESRFIKPFLDRADIIWLGSPIYYNLVSGADKILIYDKMDDYEQLTKSLFLKKLIRKNEKKLLSQADIIFASSKLLYDQLCKNGCNAKLVRNGLDVSFINKECPAPNHVTDTIIRYKQSGYTIFGYVGTIDHWFDYSVVQQIVEKSKNNKVVIVGHNNLPRFEDENVHYFDAVAKDELASIIKLFDLCLYPFKIGPFLDTIDPVKIYEYLSLNKKTIAIRSAETMKYEKYISLYDNYEELNMILDRVHMLQIPFKEHELSEFIARNSWEQRTSTILHYLNTLNRERKNI